MQPVPECLKAFGLNATHDVIGGILVVEFVIHTPEPASHLDPDDDYVHQKVHFAVQITGVVVNMMEASPDGDATSATWEEETPGWQTVLHFNPINVLDTTMSKLICDSGEFWRLTVSDDEVYGCIIVSNGRDKYSPQWCRAQANQAQTPRYSGTVRFIPRH